MSAPPRRLRSARQMLAAAILAVPTLLVFANTFEVPFLFDDQFAINQNPTIRRLWPLWNVLSPPHTGAPVDSRPMVNLSLAVNYTISGMDVWSYHAVNLSIHILTAFVLLGVVRRTLTLPNMPAPLREAATALATSVALLWAIHPLQTESVTYISQRAESLVALFYLSTLYCAIRGASSARPTIWFAAAVLASTFGMASKEVMVSAPLIVLLYDRTFLAGSFREALRKRWGLYGGLAATWLLLAGLVIGSDRRGNTAGFGLSITPWEYALTQLGAIPHYLRLSVWPNGLCLDYGASVVHALAPVLPQAIVVVGLVALTIWALYRRPAAGLLGAFFLAVLAPTSSIVPITTQTVAEHRMYLPLASLVTAVVVGGFLAGRRLMREREVPVLASPVPARLLVAVAAVVLGVLTFQRNADYQSDLSIWSDTVAKAPDNPRAHNNLGWALAQRGRYDEAAVKYRRALELKPDYAEAHNNVGGALAAQGRFDEAITSIQKALDIRSDDPDAHNNLGVALAGRGEVTKAIEHYQMALTLRPQYAEAQNNLSWVLATSSEASVRDGARAVDLALEVVQLSGGRDPAMLDTLAAAQAEMGRYSEAVDTAQRAQVLATAKGQTPLAEAIESRIKLYRVGSPFHEPPPQPSLPGSTRP